MGVDHVYFKLAIPFEQGSEFLVSAKEIQQVKSEPLKAKSRAVKCFLSTNINNVLSDIDNERFRIDKDSHGYDPYLPSKYCCTRWFFGRINSDANYYICCRETASVENVKNDSLISVFFSDKMRHLLNEGGLGASPKKRMWSKCNFCYHLDTNKEAGKWLGQKENMHTYAQ